MPTLYHEAALFSVSLSWIGFKRLHVHALHLGDRRLHTLGLVLRIFFFAIWERFRKIMNGLLRVLIQVRVRAMAAWLYPPPWGTDIAAVGIISERVSFSIYKIQEGGIHVGHEGIRQQMSYLSGYGWNSVLWPCLLADSVLFIDTNWQRVPSGLRGYLAKQ
jgi:hypothetical protein